MKLNQFVRLALAVLVMAVLASAVPVGAVGMLDEGPEVEEKEPWIDGRALWDTLWPIVVFGGIMALIGQFSTEGAKEILRRLTYKRQFTRKWLMPKGPKSAILAFIVAIVIQHNTGINLFKDIELLEFVDQELLVGIKEGLTLATLWIGSMLWDKSGVPTQLFEATPVEQLEAE